jgi:hypothetical protein
MTVMSELIVALLEVVESTDLSERGHSGLRSDISMFVHNLKSGKAAGDRA